jgi:hypothetical protein
VKDGTDTKQEKRSSPLAILSVVLGVVGLLMGYRFAILAVIAGHAALYQIRRSNGTLDGEDKATYGLALGYTMIGVKIACFLLGSLWRKLDIRFFPFL